MLERVLPCLLPSLLFSTPHFHSSFRVHPREEVQPSSIMSSDVQLRDRTDPLTTCDRESGDPAGDTSDWEQVSELLHRTTVRAFSALTLVCCVFYALGECFRKCITAHNIETHKIIFKHERFDAFRRPDEMPVSERATWRVQIPKISETIQTIFKTCHIDILVNM